MKKSIKEATNSERRIMLESMVTLMLLVYNSIDNNDAKLTDEEVELFNEYREILNEYGILKQS